MQHSTFSPLGLNIVTTLPPKSLFKRHNFNQLRKQSKLVPYQLQVSNTYKPKVTITYVYTYKAETKYWHIHKWTNQINITYHQALRPACLRTDGYGIFNVRRHLLSLLLLVVVVVFFRLIPPATMWPSATRAMARSVC